jgi:hypothetical protein
MKLSRAQCDLLKLIAVRPGAWQEHVVSHAESEQERQARAVRRSKTLSSLIRLGLVHFVPINGTVTDIKGRQFYAALSGYFATDRGLAIVAQLEKKCRACKFDSADTKPLKLEQVLRHASEPRPAPDFNKIAVALETFAEELRDEAEWLRTIHPGDNERGGTGQVASDTAVLFSLGGASRELAERVLRTGNQLGYTGSMTKKEQGK